MARKRKWTEADKEVWRREYVASWTWAEAHLWQKDELLPLGCLLSEMDRGKPDSYPALLDLFEDLGADHTRQALIHRFGLEGRKSRLGCQDVLSTCVVLLGASKAAKMVLRTISSPPERARGDALFPALLALVVDDVPVVTPARYQNLKEQAGAARDLFRRLKLKGVGFVAPRSAKESAVRVRLPRCGSPATMALLRASPKFDPRMKVLAILLRAFPAYVVAVDPFRNYLSNPWWFC
jgi:hypothetical protein